MGKKTKHNILLRAAAEGSFWTRLSFVVMGAGCIRYKQYVRGLLYFFLQIGFLFFFKNFALQYLSKFGTLGTETQRKVWNEQLQIFQHPAIVLPGIAAVDVGIGVLAVHVKHVNALSRDSHIFLRNG